MANRSLFASGESIGQYTVDELLGPGHHYIVYRAHDAFEQTCVLKVLLSGRQKDRDAERAAADRTGGIAHGHIARVLGIVEVPEATALVTDYVNGPSLRRWLGHYRPTPDEVLALFKGVLRGVDALHEAGVVHGTINPGNVLLGPTDEGLVTKVTDFGTRRMPDALSMYACRYLAPEVLSEESVADVRADIWALGCILYELATGRPPFDATDRDTLEEVLRTRKLPAMDATPGLPPALEQAIVECLRKNPDLRPTSTDELSEKLYGNTLVRRIAASRDPGEQAEQRGTAFASSVGLAVARSLGPGEGAEPPRVSRGRSVEAVARSNFLPRGEEPESGRGWVIAGGVFMALGLASVLCAGGILVLSAG